MDYNKFDNRDKPKGRLPSIKDVIEMLCVFLDLSISTSTDTVQKFGHLLVWKAGKNTANSVGNKHFATRRKYFKDALKMYRKRRLDAKAEETAGIFNSEIIEEPRLFDVTKYNKIYKDRPWTTNK